MSALGSEVIEVDALSTTTCLEIAEIFVKAVQPEVLTTPQPVRFDNIVDQWLPKLDIHVSPARAEELGDAAALTGVDGEADDPIEILMAVRYYNALFEPHNSDSHYARATIAHEMGHALVHVPDLRARPTTLKRKARGDIPPYRDSEWQAWTIGGGIAMPITALRAMKTITITKVARTFEVSTSFATSHLRRVEKAGLL